MPAFLKSALQWCFGLALFALVASLFFPCMCGPMGPANAKKAAANGKQIALVLTTRDGHGLLYPSEFPSGTTAASYLNALVKEGVLNERDLKILSVPGVPALPSGKPISDRFIGFTVFRVSPDDPPGTVFLMTKPKVSHHFLVVITKDGQAFTYERKKALDPLEQYIASGTLPAAMPLETKATAPTR